MVSPLFLQGVIIPPPAEIKLLLLLTLIKKKITWKSTSVCVFKIKMQIEQGQTPDTLPVFSALFMKMRVEGLQRY